MSLHTFCSSSDAHSSSTTLDSRPHLPSTLTTCSLVGHSKPRTSMRRRAICLLDKHFNSSGFPRQGDATNRNPLRQSKYWFSTTVFGSLFRGSSVLKLLNWANNMIKNPMRLHSYDPVLSAMSLTPENIYFESSPFLFQRSWTPLKARRPTNTCARRVLPTKNNRLWHYINWIQGRISHFNTPSQ